MSIKQVKTSVNFAKPICSCRLKPIVTGKLTCLDLG